MERAHLYRKWARLYFEAALAADEKIGLLPGYESIAPPPVMMNCAQAIELSIKAALLEAGVSKSDVRKHSHSLTKAWKHLKIANPNVTNHLTGDDEEVLKLLSESHEEMSFRYGERPKSGRMPVFGPVQVLVEKFLAICDAPSFEEMYS